MAALLIWIKNALLISLLVQLSLHLSFLFLLLFHFCFDPTILLSLSLEPTTIVLGDIKRVGAISNHALYIILFHETNWISLVYAFEHVLLILNLILILIWIFVNICELTKPWDMHRLKQVSVVRHYWISAVYLTLSKTLRSTSL